MIYGQDEPVALPTVDLYDSGMMKLALDAARELYIQSRDEQKEFLKLYGDFYSPFAKDNDYWYNHTTEPVLKLMQDAASQGIDLTRSPEGRALLTNTLRNIPYGKLAEIRAAAKQGEQYLKNMADLLKAGKYSPELEHWDLERQGLPDFDEWDTATMGPWKRVSPLTYQTLHDFVAPIVDDTDPGELSKDEVLAFGMPYDARRRYVGVSEDMLRNPIIKNIPGLVGNPIYDFYHDLARKDLIRESNNPDYVPSEEDVMNRFLYNAVKSVPEYLKRPTSKADEFALQDQETRDKILLEHVKGAEDRKTHAANKAVDNYYDSLSIGNQSGNGSGGGYNGGNITNPNDIIPQGSADEQLVSRLMKREENISKDVSSYKSKQNNAWNQQVSAYNKLNSSDKKVAVKYGKAYRTVQKYGSSKNLSTRQKKELEDARNYIRSANGKRDLNFINWKLKFTYRMENYSKSPEQYVADRMTTQGRANFKTLTEDQLYRRSNDIYERYNTTGSLSDQQKTDIASALHYSSDKEGNAIGKMTPDRDFKALVVAQLTGSRTYRYNSLPKTVSRAMKGQKYIVTKANKAGRIYGSGIINNKTNNTIEEVATFGTDSNVVKALEKYTDAELNAFGITRHKGGVDIPIITRYEHGPGWANINTQSDKQTGGVAHAKDLRTARQAREFVTR